jgi:hypothetical protein
MYARDLELPAPPAREHYADYVSEAASRFGIPALWIDAVMQAESFGDAAATSPKGAMGLMQIMPRTWAELRGRYGLGANPYDPHDNILAGAAYLRELYDRYGPDGFLAAYNAGPGRYEEHLNAGRALPPETQAYVEQLSRQIGLNASGGTIIAATLSPTGAASQLFTSPKVGNPAAAATAISMQNERAVSARGVERRFALAPQSAGLFVPLSRKGSQP